MKILGISYVYYNPSAALIKNGKLISAVEEERFNRIKRGVVNPKLAEFTLLSIFPYHSIKHVMESTKTESGDIDAIAVGFSPDMLLKKIIKNLLTNPVGIHKTYGVLGLLHLSQKLKVDTKIFLEKIFSKDIPEIFFVPHHTAHAANSVYCSGWEESSFIAWDRIGELVGMITGVFRGEIEQLSAVNYFSNNLSNSLGMLYSAVNSHLGFDFGQEGKVMGLAPYGKPKYDFDIIHQRKLKYETSHYYEGYLSKICPPRSEKQHISKIYRDIASSLQSKVNQIGVNIAETLVNRTGIGKLCLSGGVSLNCTLNKALLESEMIDEIFIPPGPSDQGTAIGAALHVYQKLTNKNPLFKMENAYYGPEFSDEEIEMSLEESNIKYQKIRNPGSFCVDLLSHGKIVGWFQGRMEFGPRALGNRSILADPRDKKIRDKVNIVKSREQWRPLAPSVLDEKGDEYFENYFCSPFMNISFDVKKEKSKEIVGIVHVDGTSRIQSVEKKQNPIFYELIKNFEKRTGVPMVLNTSFNFAGEPIVCTPEDAIRTFYSTGLDNLFLGNYLISK